MRRNKKMIQFIIGALIGAVFGAAGGVLIMAMLVVNGEDHHE